MPVLSSLLSLAFVLAFVAAQHYSATYLPDSAPKQSEQGQTGTNQCGSQSSQESMCQNVFVNSVEDFCLFAPPSPGPGSTIGETERIEVAWCVQSGHGTRVIPEGTISGAHFVQTPDYVQVTGVGDLTKLNIPAGDAGGELDPHGADGNGNPIGGLVFGSSFGTLQQYHEWTNFMGATEFCIRACKDGTRAPTLCQHIYDVLGCAWNMPGNYDAGSFEDCQGDTGEPMGVYGSSTFHQGDPVTPPPHPAPASSNCQPRQSLIASSGAPSDSGSTTGTAPIPGSSIPSTMLTASATGASSGSSMSSVSTSGPQSATDGLSTIAGTSISLKTSSSRTNTVPGATDTTTPSKATSMQRDMLGVLGAIIGLLLSNTF